MKHAFLVFGIAGLALVGFATPRLVHAGAAQEQTLSTVPCPDTLPHELMVLYEVSGGTLTGPVDSLLAVYSDGVARYSSSLGPGPGFAYTVQVGPEVAGQLRADLLAAGAAWQCDQPDFSSDIPLSTLTVLRGSARQHGNTFSWLSPEGDVATIEALLVDFIASEFPPAPPAGSGF